MKRSVLLSSLLAAVIATAPSLAQSQRYPEAVRALYEKADAEVSALYAERGCEKKAGPSLLPRIAVPDCPEKDLMAEMVRQAGCAAVAVPPAGSLVNPFTDLRDLAASWDGAFLPDGWVDKDNEYSLLLYKAIAERNIPCLGSSPLSNTIDGWLRRMPSGIGNLEELAEKARTYSLAKSLMDGIFTLDTHCDLPEDYPGASVGRRGRNQCSVPKMDEGLLDAQVLVSFIGQGETDEASSRLAAEKNFRQIKEIKADIAAYSASCGFASNPEEASALKAEGKKAFFIGIENSYGIGYDLANIKKARDEGVIYITLCHFYDNAVCNTSSNKGSDPDKGLTEFGRKVVDEMNRQGLMIDLSHPSRGTFWDCIALSKAPIVCTHSGAKAVYGHDRGLDDRQLKALAENGGVIQVYTVADFMTRDGGKADLDVFMAHFNHCVEVAGAGHVGIGSDFDGGGGVTGFNGDNDCVNVTVKMLEHGYTREEIEGFWGGNFLRVMREVQAIADRD